MTEPGNTTAPDLGEHTDTTHPDDYESEQRKVPENEDGNDDADAVEPPD
ncbi:hypothetical protein [Nocardia jiangsuensis]|uniref:Uncharacterized protein n=1 Tax=Nocardia jiangsuensis TaxID=1691563 RepID=A0ABV8DSL6_9NOCA